MKLFSVLDLAPIIEGGDAAQAFHNSLDLAQHAEAWGYHRYWLAEHHTFQALPAQRHRSSSVTSPAERKAFAWARAV